MLLSPLHIHPTYADQKGAALPIRVTIIQCGARDDIVKTREAQPACCVFVDPAQKDETIEIAELNACDGEADQNGLYPHCFEGGE